MQLSISPKTISPGQTPGARLDVGKNPPHGIIIVYENPPLGTKQGVKAPPQDMKLENLTNVSVNSDTI